MNFEYLVGFAFWLIISLIVIVYIYKNNKNSKDLKKNLLQSAILPLIITIGFGYLFVDELTQKNTITQQQNKRNKETINYNSKYSTNKKRTIYY